MTLLLISQTIFLPLFMSLILYSLYPRHEWQRNIGLLLIWLLSYFWIVGSSVFLPGEALDWIGLTSTGILLVSFVRQFYRQQKFYVLILSFSLLLYGWPVISQQFSLFIFSEFIFILFIVTILFFQSDSQKIQLYNNPALVLTISTCGLVVVALSGGSLLIAQLVGILASTLTVFAFFEIFNCKPVKNLNNFQFLLLFFIYLSLLYIARVYAELPVLSFILLAISPLSVKIINWRFNWLPSLFFSAIAVVWIYLNSDNSGYY